MAKDLSESVLGQVVNFAKYKYGSHDLDYLKRIISKKTDIMPELITKHVLADFLLKAFIEVASKNDCAQLVRRLYLTRAHIDTDGWVNLLIEHIGGISQVYANKNNVPVIKFILPEVLNEF